jgi:glutaredoxin
MRPFAPSKLDILPCHVNQLGAPAACWWYHFLVTLRSLFLVALLCCGQSAFAQQYRGVDDKGRPFYSDTPPAGAKSVRKTEARAADPPEEPPPSYEMQRALKDFPVTLYTTPTCGEPCELARATLNRRGIRFTEVPVVTPETLEQVKALAGVEAVPVLVVGRTVLDAYEPTRYQSLLDSAGYPKEGTVPARAQVAPTPPAGAGAAPVAEPVKSSEAAPAKPGPYDTSGLPANRVERPGPYDASGLPANRVDRPGPYVVPGSGK